MLSFKEAALSAQTNFEPSKEIKNFWLYTKKKSTSGGSLTLPGLFETVGYSTQILAFFAILILELVPTIYGIDEGVLWQAIVAAIFIDICLAIVSHAWHDKICLDQNKLVIENDHDRRAGLKRSIAICQRKTNFFYFLILASGCLKFYFFFDAYMVLDAIAGGVLVCYLLGSILHIAYTGYFVYTSRFNYLFHKEKNRFESRRATEELPNPRKGHPNEKQVRPRRIDRDGINLDLEIVDIFGHRIYKNELGEFFFETKGLITDKELEEFINQQPDNTRKYYVARAGLELQLQSLGVAVGTLENAQLQ